jgi:hypothetical protein
MKIGDRVKTTPKYAKEIAGVITKIDTLPEKIHKNNGLATTKNHPTKTYTVATIKTNAGDIRYIGIDWLILISAATFGRIRL